MNNSVVVRFLFLMAICFDLNQARIDFSQQCKGKPDGTPCRILCRAEKCAPPYTRCCTGECHSGSTPVNETTNKADICAEFDPLQCQGKLDGTPCTKRCKRPFRSCRPPYSRCCAGKCRRGRVDQRDIKVDICAAFDPLQCQGKPDGTSCTKRCKRPSRRCFPPYSRCCAGKCRLGTTPVNEKNKADLCPPSVDKFKQLLDCKGKPDGTSCTLYCRAWNCAPPYTRCCAGECHRGLTPVNEKTNKADLCPSPVDKFGPLQCKGKPDDPAICFARLETVHHPTPGVVPESAIGDQHQLMK